MSVLEYAAIGAAGLLGAEAAGVTDVTPIGDDGEQAPIGGGGGGGGFPGVGVGEVARIAEAVSGGGGAVPTVIDSGGRTVERIREQVPTDPDGVIPEVPSVIDPTDPTDPRDRDRDRRGDGSSITDRQILAARSGRDPFGLQATNSGPLGTAAEVLNVGGSTAAEAGEFGTGFAEENPYFTAGTAIGAISPDPVTTAAGAAIGGSVEVGADTLTGGTPLGVQSPIDVTSGGAWWEGPDPLDLGGSDTSGSGGGGGGDPGRSDGGTNREQDKTTDPSDRQDGDELRGTRGAEPSGGTGPINISFPGSGGDDGDDGDDKSPARNDRGSNRSQDKNNGDDRTPVPTGRYGRF